MITTIQLNEHVKNSLNKLKISEKQTYEEVILRLIKSVEEQKRKHEELLIEGCKEMAEDGLRIVKEWDSSLMDGLDKNEKWKR